MNLLLSLSFSSTWESVTSDFDITSYLDVDPDLRAFLDDIILGRGRGRVQKTRGKDTVSAVTVLASRGPTPWAQLIQQLVSL